MSEMKTEQKDYTACYNCGVELWKGWHAANQCTPGSPPKAVTLIDGHIHDAKHGFVARFPDDETARAALIEAGFAEISPNYFR